MPDDLRTRIAAALAETDGMPWDMWSKPSQDGYLLRADAVIAELTNPIRGCTDMWHWSTGEPYRCPSCGHWMGEGYV